MLKSTGVAGDPREHFNVPQQNRSRFEKTFGVLKAKNPLGIKTSYEGLMFAISQVGSDQFQHVPAIFLKRRDTLAQAISNYRATLSGKWLREPGDDPDRGSYELNRKSVLALKRKYEQVNDVLWPNWFTEMETHPLEIWYEEMCASPIATVRNVCDFLGLPEPSNIDTGGLLMQRDELSEQWHRELSQEEQTVE